MFVNVELIYNNTYKFIQFTYKVPREYENKVYIGTIVELLFRNKKYKALVVDINVNKPNTKKIKEIQNVLFTLSDEQITFLTYLSVSNYLNIGILLSEVFNIEKYKEQKKHKSKLIKQYTQSDIGNNISKKNKNIFVTPTLETSNQLSKELIANGLDLDFYQKTGGRDEIESYINSNIDFKNIVILSNNFNYFNITDDVVFHFYDTNNISYKLPKLNGVNIIELAILKQNIFGGNFKFYNIFPALDMFDSYNHYEEVIIKNDITYIYGNNFEECINILKNKFQYDKCFPYTNSEILKNELISLLNSKRDEIIDYIKSKYGQEKVGQMITFQTMMGRGAIKDVLRAYGGISFDEMNRVFNMGIGMIIIVSKNEVAMVEDLIRVKEIGEIEEGKRGVRIIQ